VQVSVAKNGKCGETQNSECAGRVPFVAVRDGGKANLSHPLGSVALVNDHHDFTSHRRLTVDDYRDGIHGVRLRYAALAVLLFSRRVHTIDEIWAAINERHRVAEHLKKSHLTDALRYEVRKGRVRRVDVGRYEPLRMSKRTEYRVRQADRQLRPWTERELGERMAAAWGAKRRSPNNRQHFDAAR